MKSLCKRGKKNETPLWVPEGKGREGRALPIRDRREGKGKEKIRRKFTGGRRGPGDEGLHSHRERGPKGEENSTRGLSILIGREESPPHVAKKRVAEET